MSYKKPSDRAQATGSDFLVGYFIFFLVATLTITLWSSTFEKIQSSENFYDLEETTVDVAEKLVRTRGVPSNWNRSAVNVTGLADTPRILSREKVLEFVRIMNDSQDAKDIYLDTGCDSPQVTNYECNKERLGVGKYDFYFELKDMNGTIINVDNITCKAGRSSVNETQEVTITRTAILDNRIARMILTLWYPKEERL